MDHNLPLYRFVLAVSNGVEKLRIITTAPNTVQAKHNVCAQLRALDRNPSQYKEYAERKQQLIRLAGQA